MTREEILKIAKPILFNTEMVRAILDGRKTVARKIYKPNPTYYTGEYLYVRERWYCDYDMDKNGFPIVETKRYIYSADNNPAPYNNWVDRNFGYSNHMPKEAARIFLRVTDVRVERLQSISENEILQECDEIVCEDVDGKIIPYGSREYHKDMLRMIYGEVWDRTIKKSDFDKYCWEANPYVWCISFKRIEVE